MNCLESFKLLLISTRGTKPGTNLMLVNITGNPLDTIFFLMSLTLPMLSDKPSAKNKYTNYENLY
jgi:hypothetical protein